MGEEIVDFKEEEMRDLRELKRDDELKKSYEMKEIKNNLTNNLVNIANTKL